MPDEESDRGEAPAESIEDLFGAGRPADDLADQDDEDPGEHGDGEERQRDGGDGLAGADGDGVDGGDDAERSDVEPVVDDAEAPTADGTAADDDGDGPAADGWRFDDDAESDGTGFADAGSDGGTVGEAADDGVEGVVEAGGAEERASTGIEAGGSLDGAVGGAVSGAPGGPHDGPGPVADDDREGRPGGTGDDAPPDGGWLSTGIDPLDSRLGGGLPPGRILSFVATADTQSELLVKHLAAQHDCLYLSTLRPKWEVEEEVTDYVQKHSDGADGTRVRIEHLSPDSRLDAARRHVEALERRSIVVIDSANELEAIEKDRYVYFVDEVKRTLWETGSVGLFYCIEEEPPPVGRDVTLRRADVIWQLRPAVDRGELHHQLLISKFRGGRALSEPLTLYLTDDVRMDEDPGAD